MSLCSPTFALQRWEELICAAFTKSVPCRIVNIINNENNEKELLELGSVNIKVTYHMEK